MSTPPPPPSTHSETALAGSSGSSRQGKAADAVPDHIAAPSAADSDREPDRTDVEKMDPAAVRPREAAAADENPLFQPRTVKFWLTLVMNFAALFLVALDRTIIATAVPRISDEFHSLGDVGWYGAAYMLTTSCAQLVYGRIYKFYNLKLSVLPAARALLPCCPAALLPKSPG